MFGFNGRLGFHGYGLEGRYQVPFANIRRGQGIDRQAFELRGVLASFLAKIFTSPISEMWLPSALGSHISDIGDVNIFARKLAKTPLSSKAWRSIPCPRLILANGT